MPPTILVPQSHHATIRQEGKRVLILVNGTCIADMPWEAALEFGRAIIAQAHKAEELAKADQIIMEQALAARAGLPFGLVTRPDMAHEAGKEAAWNTTLRRQIPNSQLEHTGIVYAPSVHRVKGK